MIKVNLKKKQQFGKSEQFKKREREWLLEPIVGKGSSQCAGFFYAQPSAPESIYPLYLYGNILYDQRNRPLTTKKKDTPLETLGVSSQN